MGEEQKAPENEAHDGPHAQDAEPGHIAQLNSGGIWGALTAAMLLIVLEVDDGNTAAGVILAGMDLGLVGGALFARYAPMSRGRAALIDMGGVLGGLLGLGTIFLVEGDATDERHVGAGTIAGMWIGLATGAYLTDRFGAFENTEPDAVTLLPPVVRPLAMGGDKASSFGICLDLIRMRW